MNKKKEETLIYADDVDGNRGLNKIVKQINSFSYNLLLYKEKPT